MIIATFGPTTAWTGKTITGEGDVFTLEGHGPISAQDVMEYDRQGQLVWANDGTRAWVGAKATAPSVSATGASTNPTSLTIGGGPSDGSSAGTSSLMSFRSTFSQHLLLVIVVVAAVVIVTVVLAVAGVFGGHSPTESTEPQPVAVQPEAPALATSSPESETLSWPASFVGTWHCDSSSRAADLDISDTGGQAAIRWAQNNGVVSSYTFAGDALTLASSGLSAPMVFRRQAPSTEPYAGTYQLASGGSTMTLMVGFSGRTLTFNFSGTASGIANTETYTLSEDANTLTNYDSGQGVTMVFARQ